MKKAFTLIELMIVVAVIAIIAAIAIPSLLRARQAANETNASSACKTFTSHQAVWKRTDADGNGVADYWTADIGAFYTMKDGDGNILKYVDIGMACADFAPSAAAAATYGLVYPNGTAGGTASASPKAGYYYMQMRVDENGNPYASDTSPDDGVANPYSNKLGWAIVAFPAAYNKDGIRIFIVNVEGVVYGVDNRKNAAEEYGNPVTAWPNSDPTTVAGASGKLWTPVTE